MTHREAKIEWMMKECEYPNPSGTYSNIGRKTAIAYLEAAEWFFFRAIEDFKADAAAVQAGKLEWKYNPKD